MAYPRSVHTTARALTYSYVHIRPQAPNTQYILFLHGFPSTSYSWRHQISFFAAKGYGILVPDLLGFGGTSKPDALEMYKAEGMVKDVVEIMDFEGAGLVVGVAHDWGTLLLSRLANYHPERFSSYVFIDHGYSAPGRSLTPAVIQHINSSAQAKLGYSILGYFLFFDEEDATELLNEHSERVELLFYSTDEEMGKRYKGAPGGLRTWLTEGTTIDLPAYLTAEVQFSSVMHRVFKSAYIGQDHENYQDAFSIRNGGYGPATNWYKAFLRNINEEDEKKIPPSACNLTHPTLLITSTNFVTVTMNIPEQMRPLVPELIIENVAGGHWLQLEKADEVNMILEKFIEDK